MRVAVPIWQHRVSPVFDTAARLLLCEVEDGHEVSRTEQFMGGLSLPARTSRLVELGVDVLLCGALSRELASILTASGIKVVPWVSGSVDDVVNCYISGKPLDSRFQMPGCGRCRHRFGGPRRHDASRYWAEGTEGTE